MLFLNLLKLMFLQPSMSGFTFCDSYTKTKGLFSYLNIHARARTHTHTHTHTQTRTCALTAHKTDFALPPSPSRLCNCRT